jgi:glycosyltransferase involved in cell wall biosynthesis
VQPKVSVIVPTYNRADLLPQTLASVLSQSYGDFELLVVDDGSTDDTSQVIAAISDARVVSLRQEHSGLPAVGRNTGIRQAAGIYIAFLDSDDLWLPDKLTRQVAWMDDHPGVGLSYTNCYRFVDDPANHERTPLLQPHEMLSGYAFDQLYGWPKIPNLTVMIRSAVVAVVGYFDEDPRLKSNEDYEFWLRIAARYPIDHLAAPLALYREHAGGISKAAVASGRSKLAMIEKLDRLYPQTVTHLAARRARWLASVHYSIGRSLLRENDVVEARRHLRAAWQLDRRPVIALFWVASHLSSSVYRHLDGARTNR